ncbi:hypothetical protein GCM10007905_19240 [Mixta theicola]|nr:hypothetical protein GCM10007905_19240 [Mixta theicola]
MPFAPTMAVGAARIARVRMGGIRLIEHEAIKGLPRGGHYRKACGENLERIVSAH